MLSLDIETIPQVDPALFPKEEDAAKFCATTPPLAKIVCVGMQSDKGKLAYLNSDLFSPADLGPDDNNGIIINLATEAEMATKALGYLDDNNRWPIITFGGRLFDFPVLFAAALRHSLRIPDKFSALLTEYRYGKTHNHVDMMEILSGFGTHSRKAGLRAWCVGLGLGDPKSEADGSQVGELVKQRKAREIAKYCLGDCTYALSLYRLYVKCTGIEP
jgi:hypothetical protein